MPNSKSISKIKEKPLGYVVEKQFFEKFLSKDIKAQLILNAKAVDIKKEEIKKLITTDLDEKVNKALGLN